MTPKQKFRLYMFKEYLVFGKRAAKNTQKEALEYITGLKRIFNKDIAQIDKIAIKHYTNADYLANIRLKLERLRLGLYRSYKRNLKIQKADWIKDIVFKDDPTIGYELSAVDYRAIEMLTYADMIFIRDHAAKTEIARQIKQAMIDGRANKLSIPEITNSLKEQFASYAPKEWVTKFGESNYWKLIVRNQDTLTKTNTTLNDFAAAGYKTYRWYARMSERTCPICAELHNKVFSVEAAQGQFIEYFNAADRNDVDGMKSALNWLSNPEQAKVLTEEDGYSPPAHGNCECFLRMDLGVPYE